jgi:two-component system cell cycle response regulator
MPILLPQRKDDRDASPAKANAPFVKPLVLVVEDHDDTRFLLQYLLIMRGCRVVVAEDGEKAVNMAKSEHPDLVLMDISLPHLDGLGAVRRMRELVALHDVPIIFLSGHAQPSFRAVALDTGGNDYLVKPLEITHLERILERHLGTKGTAKAE